MDLTGTDAKKERPRKRGAGRFFEVLFGNFRDLIKLDLLFCCSALLSAAAFVVGFFGVLTAYMYLLALLTALPIGGALSACFFCVTKMLRDEPGYIGHDFRRKFKENFKQAAAPGMLCAVFVYVQVFLWGPLIYADGGIGLVWLILGIVVLLLFGMVVPYVFLQIAYIDLKTSQILKNSVLISFINAPRSLMGALTAGVMWVIYVFFLPDSLLVTPIIVLVGIPISWLLNMMWVWPPVDKQFKIDETLREKRENPAGNDKTENME